MTQVILDEAGDEVIAVVVASLPAQGQRMAVGLGGGFQAFRLQLCSQEIIAVALVDQDR